MSDTANTETILKSEITEVQPVLDKLGRSYATGKKKMPLQEFGSSQDQAK
jgi:hypothetical protein